MKTASATLIACLFAGAAFAQTSGQAPAQATTPDSSTSPAVAKAAAGHEKQAAKADAKDAKDAKADGKQNKKSRGKASKKARPDAGHASKEDTTAALKPAPSAG
jgi:hypothetical protein